jgi:integrase
VLDLDSISLGELFDNYIREVTPAKGSGKQSHDRRTAQLILDVLGTARRVADLTHRDAARYVAERRRRGDLRNGKTVRGGPLRARIIGYDVRFFKAVLTWAVNSGLLSRNPLAGFTVPAEAAPRRPVVTAPQYEALLGISEQVHHLFRTALILTHETGHRVGAVRHLRWEDLDLEHQLVRWRGEHDKQGYEHETWLTPAAIEALRVARRSRSVISKCPPAADGPQPASLSASLAGLVAARRSNCQAAGRNGSGWHSLRRKFATELKLVPLKDLCALGGWKSPETVLTCYQQADAVTMQRALDTRLRLEG